MTPRTATPDTPSTQDTPSTADAPADVRETTAKQEGAMATDLRSAFTSITLRLDTYDPATATNEDARHLYVDMGITATMLKAARSLVKNKAEQRQQKDSLAASLKRLGLENAATNVEELFENATLAGALKALVTGIDD